MIPARGRGVQAPPFEGGDSPLQAQAPLSYTQQGLWFLDRLEGQNATYNLPLALRLTGSLNRDCLQKAIAATIERHESLRTKFITVEGIGQQEIVPTAGIDLNLIDIDLSEFARGDEAKPPLRDRDLRIIQLAKEEARQSFALTQAPLIRAKLLSLADNSHVLLLTVHHHNFGSKPRPYRTALYYIS